MTARRGLVEGEASTPPSSQSVYRSPARAAQGVENDAVPSGIVRRGARRLMMEDTTTIRPGWRAVADPVVTTLVTTKPAKISTRKRWGFAAAVVPVVTLASLISFGFLTPQAQSNSPAAYVAMQPKQTGPQADSAQPAVRDAGTLSPASQAAAGALAADAQVRAAAEAQDSEITTVNEAAAQIRQNSGLSGLAVPSNVVSAVQVPKGAVVYPVTGFTLTSPFGWRIHPIYRYVKFHYGNDLSIDCGQPIVASADGVVTESGYHGDLGNYIQIDSGTFSLGYAHQSKLVAKIGDHVTQGQLIGYVGSTGLSTGCHVHWQAIDSQGYYFDPLPLVH